MNSVRSSTILCVKFKKYTIFKIRCEKLDCDSFAIIIYKQKTNILYFLRTRIWHTKELSHHHDLRFLLHHHSAVMILLFPSVAFFSPSSSLYVLLPFFLVLYFISLIPPPRWFRQKNTSLIPLEKLFLWFIKSYF